MPISLTKAIIAGQSLPNIDTGWKVWYRPLPIILSYRPALTLFGQLYCFTFNVNRKHLYQILQPEPYQSSGASFHFALCTFILVSAVSFSSDGHCAATAPPTFSSVSLQRLSSSCLVRSSASRLRISSSCCFLRRSSSWSWPGAQKQELQGWSSYGHGSPVLRYMYRWNISTSKVFLRNDELLVTWRKKKKETSRKQWLITLQTVAVFYT